MEKWLREVLSHCLDFDVPDDMIKYILSLKTSQDFDDYFDSLLNTECEEHRLFLSECKKRLFSKTLPNKKHQNQQQQPKKKPINADRANIKQNMTAGKQDNNQQYQGCKKKSKYVNLYTSDGSVIGETIMLKGRHWCNCQAAQHKLINNCLSCGRIVCEQEGSGSCLFCGEVVCTNAEQQVLKGSDKKSENLLKSLKQKGGGEALKKALDQRDRLLEYDRNSEKRTTVIDDELDYFEENSVWHTGEQRAKFASLKEEIHERKHTSRANRTIKVDFAGRVLDDDITMKDYEDKILDSLAKVNAETQDPSNWSNNKTTKIKSLECMYNLDPNLQAERPIYRQSLEDKSRSKGPTVNDGLERIYNRVQDKELMEMQDMRQCISLHQPWASLLVAGIKKHEGRSWYTEHRGRLWIASTTKEPRSDEIQELEDFYKLYYNDHNLKFPEHYPTGCLLGCVKVENCLPQEEYREVHPSGESESPYVMVCCQAEQLPVVFPIKGQHKIYQIDPKIHNAACKTLVRFKAGQKG